MDRRVLIALVLGALVLVGLYGAFFFRNQNVKSPAESGVESANTAGEQHHGWTPFYHATDGTWKMLDEAVYVLREKKYVSGDAERDAYTVYNVGYGGIVRTIESEGRWKQVAVLEDGQVVATGWIDAHFVRNVEQVEEPTQDPVEGTGK